MGAGASSVPAPEFTNSAQIEVYEALKHRYEAEGEGKSDAEKSTLLSSLRSEYDAFVHRGDAEHHAAIVIGDVVHAPVDGMFFEGVVNHIEDGVATVDFGDHDIQPCPLAQCRRVLAWSALEVGDEVSVAETGTDLKFLGVITEVALDEEGRPYYGVAYEGEADNPERDVAHDRVRKMRSVRSTAVKRWKEAFHAVMAIHAFSMPLLGGGGGSKSPRSVLACAVEHHGGNDHDHDEICPSTLKDMKGFVIGDIVTCRPEDGCMWFEGVIQDLDPVHGAALVHLADEGNGEDVWVPVADVARVHHWDALEIGDRVEASPLTESLWYPAVVIEVCHEGGDEDTLEYTVQYTSPDDEVDHGHREDDEHEIEHHLPPSKVRKIQSARSMKNVERMKFGVRMVGCMRAFKLSAGPAAGKLAGAVLDHHHDDPSSPRSTIAKPPSAAADAKADASDVAEDKHAKEGAAAPADDAKGAK